MGRVLKDWAVNRYFIKNSKKMAHNDAVLGLYMYAI